MKIWITGESYHRTRCSAWVKKPHYKEGAWYACHSCDTGSTTVNTTLAQLMLGDQWQPDGPFCFEVEIGTVKRVRTKEDVIAGLRNVRINLMLDASITTIDEAIALIKNPDSSNG